MPISMAEEHTQLHRPAGAAGCLQKGCYCEDCVDVETQGVACGCRSFCPSPCRPCGNLKFTLINKSSAVVAKIQISSVSTSDWEENILGRDVLLPGEEVEISIADGQATCAHDMLVTFHDETTVEESNCDFCDLQSYTISD